MVSKHNERKLSGNKKQIRVTIPPRVAELADLFLGDIVLVDVVPNGNFFQKEIRIRKLDKDGD